MKSFLQRVWQSSNLTATLLGPHLSKRSKIVLDYSSPNIAKQFHIGNLRSTLIGQFIYNLCRRVNDEVISINYLGDWGTQFALIGALWPTMKPSDQIWQRCSDLEKLKLITDCYVRANDKMKTDSGFKSEVQKLFEVMEKELAAGNFNNENLLLWKDIKDVSLRYFDSLYSKLNVRFDITSSESEQIVSANDLVELLLSKGIAKITDNGIIVVYTGDGYNILRKSNRGTIYLSRELATTLQRREAFHADKYVYVVDNAQSSHFVSLKNLLTAIREEKLANQIHHVSFGRVIGLSTRKGRTEAVDEIINRGCKLAKEFLISSSTIKIDGSQIEDVAKNLALSAIVVNDLKRARRSNYHFTFENAFKLNHNNATLLHMKHSRLYSLEQHNLNLLDECEKDIAYNIDLTDNTIVSLVKELLKFEEVLKESYVQMEPCRVTVYLMQLSNLIGSTMASQRVTGEVHEKAVPRLFLFRIARKFLSEGMKLIGLEPLNQM